MKILLHSPVSTVRRNGNRQTSTGWASMLQEAGYEVTTISRYESEYADLLIALHANKSREALLAFQEHTPNGKVILALTGTDIYPHPNNEALDSMARSDALVTLQGKAIHLVPPSQQHKVSLIIQSARKLAEKTALSTDRFEVCVIGHLRDVKNPLLTARASRMLPDSSRIHIRHVGGILEQTYAEQVAEEEKQNPRYRWYGELSEADTAQIIAQSHLLSLTSHSEGGARVVGEAAVHGTPVVSTHIDGVAGLLGDDYPGLYPNDNATALARLLDQCETDSTFYKRLSAATLAHTHQFQPESEAQNLIALVERLSGCEQLGGMAQG